MKKYFISLGIGALTFVAIAGAQNGFTFSNNLSLGSKGSDVVELQTWLIANGYDIPTISSGGTTKGYFGLQTKSAVILYQRALGLPTFGFFGPLTRKHINNGERSVNAPKITNVIGPMALDINQSGMWN